MKNGKSQVLSIKFMGLNSSKCLQSSSKLSQLYLCNYVSSDGYCYYSIYSRLVYRFPCSKHMWGESRVGISNSDWLSSFILYTVSTLMIPNSSRWSLSMYIENYGKGNLYFCSSWFFLWYAIISCLNRLLNLLSVSRYINLDDKICF